MIRRILAFLATASVVVVLALGFLAFELLDLFHSFPAPPKPAPHQTPGDAAPHTGRR